MVPASRGAHSGIGSAEPDDFPLARSASFAVAWGVLDRLGTRLREAVSPGLKSGQQMLELERSDERSRLIAAISSVGTSPEPSWSPVTPTSGSLRCLCVRSQTLEQDGAAIVRLSLRDLPNTVAEFEGQLGGYALDDVMAAGAVRPVRAFPGDGAEAVLEGRAKCSAPSPRPR